MPDGLRAEQEDARCEHVRGTPAQLRAHIESRFAIVGSSTGIRALIAQNERVASTPARVLVPGENGPGQEPVAPRVQYTPPPPAEPLWGMALVSAPSLRAAPGWERGTWAGS